MSRRLRLELAQLAIFSAALAALLSPAIVLGAGADLASCSSSTLQAFPAIALGLFVALGLLDVLSHALARCGRSLAGRLTCGRYCSADCPLATRCAR